MNIRAYRNTNITDYGRDYNPCYSISETPYNPGTLMCCITSERHGTTCYHGRYTYYNYNGLDWGSFILAGFNISAFIGEIAILIENKKKTDITHRSNLNLYVTTLHHCALVVAIISASISAGSRFIIMPLISLSLQNLMLCIEHIGACRNRRQRLEHIRTSLPAGVTHAESGVGVLPSSSINCIESEKAKDIPEGAPPKFASLIASCWKKRTESRSSVVNLAHETQGISTEREELSRLAIDREGPAAPSYGSI